MYLRVSHVCIVGRGAFFLQHTDPDYSAAYVVLETDAEDGLQGYGLTFTLGKGTEVGEFNILVSVGMLHFHLDSSCDLTFVCVYIAQRK